MKTFLKKIYFEPDSFTGKKIDPIYFEKGLNFIIGDRSETDKRTGMKMNSVGKSLLIEMINFCLFKDSNHSRVEKIPIVTLNDNVYICLDLEIDTGHQIKNVTIKRTRSGSKEIVIVENQKEKSFKKLEDAKVYFEYLFFSDVEDRPSFRNLLSILIRDEKTIYDSIIKSFHGVRNFSDLIKPHLYLFGFDSSKTTQLKAHYSNLDKINKAVSTINSSFKMVGINVSEIKSYINELQDKVDKLELSIDELKPSENIEQKNNEFNALVNELDSVMSKLSAQKYAIDRIKRLPKIEEINSDDLKVIYNQYKLGLGDLVKRSIDQVTDFKKQIDNFQNDLMTRKLRTLEMEVASLNSQRNYLDTELSKIYESRKAKEKIDSLKEAIANHVDKNRELATLSEKYKIIEEQKNLKKTLDKEIRSLLDSIDIQLFDLGQILLDFEDDLKKMHNYIAGNMQCHFNIETNMRSKEYIKIDYRVNFDGGSGTNHIRTFIYDVLLMINEHTSKRHPGFLIHDNIFASAGLDDMTKSLNFLDLKEKEGIDFQYIVTINKDEFDLAISKFSFNYEEKVRAKFTRDNQFLKTSYREV